MKDQNYMNSGKLSYPSKILVSNVSKSFNTWRFKRSQPSDTMLLDEFVSRALCRGGPIPFVLYWGKGFRSTSGVNERACLDYLAEMGGRVSEVYGRGAHFDILYTDTHARLNGHAEADIQAYGASIESECGGGFKVSRLSEVVASANVSKKEIPPVPSDEAEEFIGRLKGCAEKWYRGTGQAVDGAAQYFWMNMVERIAVERMFPNSIFITFNGKEMRPIFPDRLPVFYMYSVKKGTSVKPWFMDEPDASPDCDSQVAVA